ncbi:MAG: MBL fold metallo-hydrolase, partial [Acidimicrobiia bacterium]
EPTDAERIHVLGEGDDIVVGGGRILTAIVSPGHAKHHLGLHDSDSGLLFVGDAVGVRLPDAGILRPATPPPDFDLEAALDSLDRFSKRSPSGLALAHYGLLSEPQDTLVEAGEILRRWAHVAEVAWKAGEDIAEALDREFAFELASVPEEHRAKLETLNGVHSNAAGFKRWLDTRNGAAPGVTHPFGHAHSHGPGHFHVH